MTSPCSRRAWLAAGGLPPAPPRCDVSAPAPVFASQVVLLDVRFVAARVRLANLIRAGGLTEVSAAAWACGLAALPGFWVPGGAPPGLARVRLLEPAAGPGIVTLPLRWQTAGPVRVLNAGLTLLPDGADRTLLRLDGVFRLPSAVAGRKPGGAMLAHRAAAASAGFLLTGVAAELTRPAPRARPDELPAVIASEGSRCRGSGCRPVPAGSARSISIRASCRTVQNVRN